MDKKFYYGKIEEQSEDLDRAYWQNASDQEKFDEAWRLVELAFQLQGKNKDELRFQRSVGGLQPLDY